MFSLYLARKGIQSKMWFGGYSNEQVESSLAASVPADELKDMSMAEKAGLIKWAPLSSFIYWSAALTKVQLVPNK